jgi:hypothetical protein
MSTMTNKPLAVGVAAVFAIAGALALGASAPAQSAPMFGNPLAVKEAAPSQVEEVRRRRWRRHSGHFFAGLALGAIGAHVFHHGYAYHRKPRRHRHIYYYRSRGPDCIRAYGDVYCRY